MNAVIALKNYALRTGLIDATEERWAVNTILDTLRCDALPELEVAPDAPLHAISQESFPTPQLKSINSSVLSFLHSPTLTSIHDYWKNRSFKYVEKNRRQKGG